MVAKQGYDSSELETIVVDSGSTDETLSIAENFGARIIKIPVGKFSYPYASDVGANEARGKYLVYLSGHSVPMKETMLSESLRCWRKLEEKEKVALAGIYGPVVALPGKDSTVWEKLFFSVRRPEKLRPKVVRRKQMGLLGCTNAIIRKSAW